MAKPANRHTVSWSEDAPSGVRRSQHSRVGNQNATQLTRASQPPRSALACLAVLVLLSVWLWSRPSEVGGGSSAQIVVKRLPLSAAAPPQLSAEEPALPLRPTVELELSAWPPEARLMLDGTPLPTNPYRARVPADDGLHVLRAVAGGLQAKERVITLDRDRSLRLTLSRVTQTRLTRRSEQAELAPVPPAAPRQRTREIYEEDPYR